MAVAEPGIPPGRTYPDAVPGVSTNRWDELSPPETGHWLPRKRASVVVPYYDSLAALRRTLIGLAAQTYPADLTEIIVVDDGSPRPLEASAIEDLVSARIITRPDAGFTLAAARNEGADSAQGDVLVFLDHDMLPDPDWLESHMRWHHTTESRPMLVLGSRSHLDDGWLTEEIVSEAMQSGGLKGKLDGREVQVPEWIEFHLQRTSGLTSADDDIFRIVTGGNLSVSRDFFDAIGGFDESFVRWGGEDTEFGYRAWVSGALLVPERGAHCWHQGLGVSPDHSETLSQRIQRHKLAHLIPIPGFRTIVEGRIWARPRLVAYVVGDDPDDVSATVESVLRIADAVVLIDSEHPLVVENFGPDPRVEVSHPVETGKYRFSPFHARIPAGLGVPWTLAEALIEEARKTGASETRDGVRIESMRHVNSRAATTSMHEKSAGRAQRPSSASRVMNRLRRIRSLPDAIRALRWLGASVRRRLGKSGTLGAPGSAGTPTTSRRLEADAWSRVIAIDVPALPATGKRGDPRIDLVVTGAGAGTPSDIDSRHLSLERAADPDLLSYPPLDPTIALAVLRGDHSPNDPLSTLLRGIAPDITPPGTRTAKAAKMAASGDADNPAVIEAIRRAVLVEHLSAMRLDQLRVEAGMTPLSPRVSVILATRRPDRLEVVVEAIARQTYTELEVIVATHGIDVTRAIEEALSRSSVPYQLVVCDGDETFGSVLAAASRRASGQLLAKMDDDDIYSCTHIEDLVLAHLVSKADLVGKAAEFVHLEEWDLTIRRFIGGAYSDSRTIAGGAMAVTRDALRRAGGWADVQRHVDQALIRDVLNSGGSLFRTHGIGYVLVRHDDHTWQSDESRFLDQAEAQWTGLPEWIVGDHPADGCDHVINR